MLIKDFFFKDREILLQEEMLIKDFSFFQGQGNLASGRDADKRFFFSRAGKSCFRKRC